MAGHSLLAGSLLMTDPFVTIGRPDGPAAPVGRLRMVRRARMLARMLCRSHRIYAPYAGEAGNTSRAVRFDYSLADCVRGWMYTFSATQELE